MNGKNKLNATVFCHGRVFHKFHNKVSSERHQAARGKVFFTDQTIAATRALFTKGVGGGIEKRIRKYVLKNLAMIKAEPVWR